MGITSPTDSSSTWRDRFKAFMEGGSCKESYRAYEHSLELFSREHSLELFSRDALDKCMETHSDYYQPVSATHKKVDEQAKNNFCATFMPSIKLLDQTEEVDAKRDEEVERFLAFMKGGGCKESFMALYDNDSEKNKDEDGVNKRGRLAAKMLMCQYDHYQPFLSWIESANDQLDTELEALFSPKQAEG